MAEHDWQQLKNEAKNVMDKMNTENMNDLDYAMFGASVAIIMHTEKEAVATPEKVLSVNDAEYAEKELTSADEYHKMGLDDIAHDKLRHALYWIERMRKSAYTPEQQSLVRDLTARHDLMMQQFA